MEINNSVIIKQFDKIAEPAKVAGPERSEVVAELPTIAIKAAPKPPEFEPKDIEKALSDLQAFVDGLDRSLSFRRDDSINRSIITVTDANTNQLVRQIPAEEIVEIARQIREDLDAKRAGMLLRGEA